MKAIRSCAGGALGLACLLGVWSPTSSSAVAGNDWGFVFSAPKYDIASGLTSIQLTLSETYDLSGQVQNLGGASADFSLQTQAQMSLYLPDLSGHYTAILSDPVVQMVAGDSTVDAGKAVSFNHTYSFVYTFTLTGSELVPFIGNGSVDLIAGSDVSKTLVSSGGNFSLSSTSMLGANVQVAPGFVPVPEPAAGALLLSGVAVWLGRRFRKSLFR